MVWSKLARKLGASNRGYASFKAKTKQVNKIVDKKLRRFGEMKMDNTYTNNGGSVPQASTNPNGSLLTGISGGSTIQAREGNQALLRYLRMNLNFNAGVISSSACIRCIIVKDKQSTTAALPFATVFPAVSAGNEFIANLSIVNSDRFKVVYDKFIRWQPLSNGSTTAQGQINMKIIKKFRKGMLLRYTSATNTDVVRDHLYFYVVTDVAANNPTIRAECRLKFKDPQ